MVAITGILLCLALAGLATSQDTDVPSSWPHNYPNKPKGWFSPSWQKYFEVTSSLPNVTSSRLGRSFAGNLPVDRAGHPNNTLFFVGFEKSRGSLTDSSHASANKLDQRPWGIWLNGGPGSSSMIGMLFENGPIKIKGDYSAELNPYAWNKLADYFWIDQPVGVGYATVDPTGFVADEHQVGLDFMGFLGNLVKVFPSLATRPLYLTGESSAGTYIPYILRAYFEMRAPPVNIAKIAIGNGVYSDLFDYLPSLTVLETFPQLIAYDQEVYKYFKKQEHLCHFDLNLTYPQHGKIALPDLILPARFLDGSSERSFAMKSLNNRISRFRSSESQLLEEIKTRAARMPSTTLAKREEKEAARQAHKRDLSMRANDTIDPWYGCLLLDEIIDYALNFTFPWNVTQGFDYYNIPDALNPEVPTDGTVWMNDPRTRAAFHAPTVKDWSPHFDLVFGPINTYADPSPLPMEFFDALATNATARNVSIVLYSGNNDAIVAHRGTDIVIQNTTFGGIQGFTRKPSTPWYNDAHELAGIVHQERGWTYALLLNASHLVPALQPLSAFTFLREFILGNNPTGLVTEVKGKTVVIGGENKSLSGDVIPGPDPIYVGNGTTASSYVFPKATRTAWSAFIAKETGKKQE